MCVRSMIWDTQSFIQSWYELRRSPSPEKLTKSALILFVSHLRPMGPKLVPFPSETQLLGYECGSVYPAGVELGSRSRDAANGLSSRFSRSVETRRRYYGWLRVVFSGACLLRVPNWCPSGGSGTREAGSTVAESVVAIYRVDTHQMWRGPRTAPLLTRQGSAELLRARTKSANREVSEGKDDLWPWSVVFVRGPTRSGERARFVGLFRDAQGFGRLDAGSRSGITNSRVVDQRQVQRLGGVRGRNIFVPVLGGNGTQIAPTGDIFDQPPGQMR